MSEKQRTNTILMVRPANFGFNEETAQNNAFQDNDTELTKDEIVLKAIEEFDSMVNILREEGINIIVVQDTASPVKTDAVFPNNWMSTHESGEVLWYPMFSQNRRFERRDDIWEMLSEDFQVSKDTELLSFEPDKKYLEGTGSMILDRENRIAYACYSERTHPETLKEFGDKMNYRIVGFTATDDDGLPYYHTNVIMALGKHIAIVCSESIEDETEKSEVIDALTRSGKEIVHISRQQVLAFAGNMLEVLGHENTPIMVMSTAAFHSLKDEQLNIIKNYNKIVHLPIGTIEKFGGGSVRCMMAEIFLPKRT